MNMTRTWRFATLASEGLSNARSNALRTLTLFCAFTLATAVVGYRELSQTHMTEQLTERDRRAGRDSAALNSPTTDIPIIDASSCIAIGNTPGVIRNGAILNRTTATTSLGVSFPLYAVTPGLLDISSDTNVGIIGSTNPSLILSTALAQELAVAPGRHLTVDNQILEIAAVVPSSVRDPGLDRAAFVLSPPTSRAISCVIEGHPGTRSQLSAMFASLLDRQPDATFTFYVAEKDLYHHPYSPQRYADFLGIATFVLLVLLINRRFRSAELALYTANGCGFLDRWWLTIIEAIPVVPAAAVSSALITGVGDYQGVSRAALTDGVEGASLAACAAFILVAAIAVLPFRGSLLARLKDRT
jgi:hypothetical protein